MTPRKTQNGAKARTSRTSTRGPKKAASSRTRKPASRTAAGAKGSGTRRGYITLAVVAGALAVFVWVFYPVACVNYRETREANRLSAELEALRERNDRLRAQVDRLRTPAGVEDYARSELGMAKKGEHVMVVVDEEFSAETSATQARPKVDSDEAVREPTGPWTALLDLVFGLR